MKNEYYKIAVTLLLMSLAINPVKSSGSFDSKSAGRGPVFSINDVPFNSKDIPVVITNTKIKKHDAPVALIISGDGGWFRFEQQLADKLATYGIPSVGLDSRKYFWNRKTPEETANDIAEELSHYLQFWGHDSILLVGYSLGAEIVPFIYNRLSQVMKEKVVSAVLLSPDVSTDFEIHITNMMGLGNKQNTYDVIGEIKKMKGLKTILIFGAGEKSKVPALLKGSGVSINVIPGDHHYKFDLPLIMQTIIENKAF